MIYKYSMLEYYATLDIPAVPQSIVDTAAVEIPIPRYSKFTFRLKFCNHSAELSAIYSRVELDQTCINWIIKCVPELANEKCTFGYQVIDAVPGTSGKFVPHTDGLFRGTFVLSYLLDPGSDQPVTTHWWQEHNCDKHRLPHTFITDYQKLHELTAVTIPVHQWHMLDASILHSVHGIKTRRTAITVGFNNKEAVDVMLSKYRFKVI